MLSLLKRIDCVYIKIVCPCMLLNCSMLANNDKSIKNIFFQVNLSDPYIRTVTRPNDLNSSEQPNQVPSSPSLNEDDDVSEIPILQIPIDLWIDAQNRRLSEAYFEKRYPI